MRSEAKAITIKRTLTRGEEGEPLTTEDKIFSVISTNDTKLISAIVSKIHEFDMSIVGSGSQDLWLFEIRNYWEDYYDINDLTIEYDNREYQIVYKDHDDRLRRLTLLCEPKASRYQFDES